jgi:hypothetical protein
MANIASCHTNMVRSLIPLLMYIKLAFVIINDNNGETLPNLINKKTHI